MCDRLHKALASVFHFIQWKPSFLNCETKHVTKVEKDLYFSTSFKTCCMQKCLHVMQKKNSLFDRLGK